MTETRKDREAGREFVRGLDMQQVFELGDALVLGYFNWREWGMQQKPSAAFIHAVDEERIKREETSE